MATALNEPNEDDMQRRLFNEPSALAELNEDDMQRREEAIRHQAHKKNIFAREQ